MSTTHISKKQKTQSGVHLPPGILHHILDFNDTSRERHQQELGFVLLQIEELARCVPSGVAGDGGDWLYDGGDFDVFEGWRGDYNQKWKVKLFDRWVLTIAVHRLGVEMPLFDVCDFGYWG